MYSCLKVDFSVYKYLPFVNFFWWTCHFLLFNQELFLVGDQKNNPWTEFRKKSLSRVLEKRIDETERHGEY